MKKIIVLDTTLRDGEQVQGVKLNLYEKLKIADQLKNLNVDIIDAGFPAGSTQDFKSVESISKKLGSYTSISAIARAVKEDIDLAYKCLRFAEEPLIHISIGASDIHIEKKLRKTRDQILIQSSEAIRYAKKLCNNIQYSVEDATRADFDYLWDNIENAVKAGATIINIADTVGFGLPDEFGDLVKKINYNLKNLDQNAILSVHCHNDMGLATANTLAAIKSGADKIEATINGVGERAGNAALEEIAMALKIRDSYYNAYTNIISTELKKTSKLVSYIMGLDVAANKAIVGGNAFVHSSGIHKAGAIKSRDVYEIVHSEDIGSEESDIILTMHSGRSELKDALSKLGFEKLDDEELNKIFDKFQEMVELKKEVYDYDLYYLIESIVDINPDLGDEIIEKRKNLYELLDLQVISNSIFPSASVKIKRGNKTYKKSSIGNGVVDALYTAIKEVAELEVDLREYKISSISKGKEALGKVTINLSYNKKNYISRAIDTDIIKASALAFINALNNIMMDKIK
jgi:2-isopropylmalate synthase